MIKSFIKLLIFTSITLSFAFFMGCVTISSTRPNTINRNYLGYEAFAKRNRLIADELSKLPEIQDGVSAEESKVVEKLIIIYDKNPESFDKTFNQFYQIGIPEVRQYCSPLQAFFWLIEDNKIEQAMNLFDKYDLNYLLMLAWQNKERKRWESFYDVTERLNAPELVHYYVKNNFTYTRGPINGVWENAPNTFMRKNGHCIAYARFGDYCLSKAGYKTFIRSVDFPGKPCCSDHTAAGIILKNGSYLLVVDSSGDSMTEHKNVEFLDLQIAHGSRIIGRMWGHKWGNDW